MQNLCNSIIYGYNNKDFSQTLSFVLSALCQRQVVKFARVYQSRLLHCLLLRGAPFAGIPFKIVILICILAIWLAFWFGGSISFFLWNNGARKSHAAQQTLKVRNVLSEVFVDPMLKITLVRSLTINIRRRRKMLGKPSPLGW